MCGICGAFHRTGTPPDTADVTAMNERIRHRGPDESGLHAGGPAVLAMRRLSIVDIEGGSQPMRDPDSGLTLVYNGELYNHVELRETFGAEGWQFRTRSDTEVALAALALHGPEGLGLLNGMFALSSWDERDRSLLLARDGLGIKPLFYELRSDRCVWASELTALSSYPGVSREINPTSLARYLVHEYVPTPGAMLRGIRKLEPGTWLRVTPEGERRGTFYEPPFRPPEVGDDPERAAEGFLELLEDAVRRQMVADVPVGIFLSGGLDSSALAAAAVRVAGERVRTFSVGFEEDSFDESGWARQVAGHLGTEHMEERLDPRAALDLIPGLGNLLDEPLGDASLLPTSLLCAFARKHVKVALSGDGGDELLGGYPTYPAHRVARFYRALGPLGPGLIAPLVRLLPVSDKNFSLEFKAKRFVRGAHLRNPDRHVLWMGSFHPDRLQGILRPDVFRECEDAWADARRLWAETGGGPDFDRARRYDLLTYLRDDLLAKTDRASMAHSLEVRVPLLDQEVVAWAEGLPPSLKVRGFQTKVLMRRALDGVLPREILERPKKGFGVPMAAWLRGPLQELMEELLSPAAIQAEGLFEPGGVRDLVEAHLSGARDERKCLWTLLAFRSWSQARA